MHWLAHWSGLDNPAGPIYAFWSGIGSILIPPLLTALPIVAVLLRRHNCEIHGCWRLGRHRTAAGHFLCRRHHPDGRLTHAQAVAEHHAAAGRS